LGLFKDCLAKLVSDSVSDILVEDISVAGRRMSDNKAESKSIYDARKSPFNHILQTNKLSSPHPPNTMIEISTSRTEAATDVDMNMASSTPTPASTKDNTLESIEKQCIVFQSRIDSVRFSPLAVISKHNRLTLTNSINTNSIRSKPKMQTFTASLTLTSKRIVVTDPSTVRPQSQWLSSKKIRRR